VTVSVYRDVRIPTGDPAVTLSADLYLPVDPELMEGPVPALVTAYPYRKDLMGPEFAGALRWFAERGYAGLHVDLRGIGASDGTPSPRCGAGWGEDTVTAIEWAAAQPWCTGDVGAWGISAGGVTTLAAASRHPPALKAIIPMMTTVDPERYGGARGDLGLLAQWGGGMLVQQLLPPLSDHAAPAQLRRWQERMHYTEPFLLDLARHGTGDPDWRGRVIDPATITVPALCVGGWQDVYAGAVPAIYARLRGEKRLLMGPWMHTFPQDSPFEPVDFRAIALRWWDRWLRRTGGRVSMGPPVVLHLPGEGWRGFSSWPPPASRLVYATGGDRTLCEAEPDSALGVAPIGKYRPDPTIGPLGGLGGESSRHGQALDLHDEDVRALAVTSEPVRASLAICGVPEVTFRLAGGPAPRRMVARLTGVDPLGRSTLIASGVLTAPAPGPVQRVTLTPASHSFPAGHRLRVTLTDADFPRLNPLVAPVPITVAGVEVSVPMLVGDAGTPVELPGVNRPPSARMAARPDAAAGSWTITRDLVHSGVTVDLGASTGRQVTSEGHEVTTEVEVSASVRRDAPGSAVVLGRHRAEVRASTGETVTVTATVRCTQTALWARGEVSVDGLALYGRTWEAPLVPEGEEK
jgi:uncharacterized protein